MGKYELGTKVRIKKHWKHQNRDEQLNALGISDLENHLMSDDMAGDYIHIDKYKNTDIDETGYICGIRFLKVSYDLQYVCDEPYVKDSIQQMDYQSEKIYLVATKMNTLRRVSFENIELEDEKQWQKINTTFIDVLNRT